MSVVSAKAYLQGSTRPPRVTSASEFGNHHRISTRTAIDVLRAAGYVWYEEQGYWQYEESQMDRIERKLGIIYKQLQKLTNPEPANVAQ